MGRKCRGLLRTFFQVGEVARVSGKNDLQDVLASVGESIRTARISAGLSQEALADASELDRSHLGRIERGERNLSILNLKRIANALGISAAELLKHARV